MYRYFCEQDKTSFHLVDGAQKTFEQLIRDNIPFTIASASIKSNIDFFIKSFHLDTWFDPSKIVYDDGSFESKVKMFLHAAESIGIPIEECLIFEDSESGIRDARLAGCKNIIVVDSMHIGKRYCNTPCIKQIIQNFSQLDL